MSLERAGNPCAGEEGFEVRGLLGWRRCGSTPEKMGPVTEKAGNF